jgi:hypothetical protein
MRSFVLQTINLLVFMVARGGIEPPRRGFSVCSRVFEGLINQTLAALGGPFPWLTMAHSWHTQSELVTFLAQARRNRLGTEYVDLLLELMNEHKAYLYESLPARSRRPRADGYQVRRHLVRH